MASSDTRSKVIEIVEAFPESSCEGSDDNLHLSLIVRKKRFGYYLEDHHGDGRCAINCKTSDGVRAMLEAVVPEQLHIPKYLGSKGWIGLWLDTDAVQWGPVRDALREAWILSAPRKLIRELEGDAGTLGA